MSITDGSNELQRGEYNHTPVSSHHAPQRAASWCGKRTEHLAQGFRDMVGHYYEVVSDSMILSEGYLREHSHGFQCFHPLLNPAHIPPVTYAQ